MKLDGRSLLQTVDKNTRFSAACFVLGESTKDVWEAFLCILVKGYVGYPDTLALDQGPPLTSAEWLNLASSAGTSIQPSDVESHKTTSVGERYHAYLRRTCNKVRV